MVLAPLAAEANGIDLPVSKDFHQTLENLLRLCAVLVWNMAMLRDLIHCSQRSELTSRLCERSPDLMQKRRLGHFSLVLLGLYLYSVEAGLQVLLLCLLGVSTLIFVISMAYEEDLGCADDTTMLHFTWTLCYLIDMML